MEIKELLMWIIAIVLGIAGTIWTLGFGLMAVLGFISPDFWYLTDIIPFGPYGSALLAIIPAFIITNGFEH